MSLTWGTVYNNESNIYSIKDSKFRSSYMEAYPLIAACSIMVDKKDKNFYPEYIIPQLIMQWLNSKAMQNRNSIYGIRYLSCRNKNPIIKGYNYVFPVLSADINKNNKEYCSVLSSIFSLTEPRISTEDGFAEKMENGLFEKL